MARWDIIAKFRIGSRILIDGLKPVQMMILDGINGDLGCRKQEATMLQEA
jgi:hypothetical protein